MYGRGAQTLRHETPFVSVVIPTFNSATTLRKCLDSAMSLDYPKERLEVLVIDGGSSDETVRIAREFPVTLVIEPKRIRGATYNRGLKEARGEYVGYVDSDGTVSRSWLRESVSLLSRDASVGVVYFKSEIPRDSTLFQRVAGTYQTKGKMWVRSALQGSGANGAIYQRKALLEIGGFDERMMYEQEDELTSRLERNGYKVESGSRGLVFHNPRSSISGYFLQSIEDGIGFFGYYLILRHEIAYMTVRSMIALLPILALIILPTSLFMTLLIVLGLGALTLAYFVYSILRTAPEERRPLLLFLSLPLVYLSCVGSLIGYIVGLARHARLFLEGGKTDPRR